MLISPHEIWWGGSCVGPRHLIPFAVLLSFEGIRFLAKFPFPKWLFFGISAVGVLLFWMAQSTVGYRIADEVQKPVSNGIVTLFFDKKFNSDNMLTLLFNLNTETAIYIWLFIFVGAVITFFFWHKM